MRSFLSSSFILALGLFAGVSQATLYSVDHATLMDDKGNLRATKQEIREALRELAWSDADITTFLGLGNSSDRLSFSKNKRSGDPAKSLAQFDDE